MFVGNNFLSISLKRLLKHIVCMHCINNSMFRTLHVHYIHAEILIDDVIYSAT